MPIYEFECMSCKNEFESLQGMKDPVPACPTCKEGKVVKLFSVFGFRMPGYSPPSKPSGGFDFEMDFTK